MAIYRDLGYRPCVGKLHRDIRVCRGTVCIFSKYLRRRQSTACSHSRCIAVSTPGSLCVPSAVPGYPSPERRPKPSPRRSLSDLRRVNMCHPTLVQLSLKEYTHKLEIITVKSVLGATAVRLRRDADRVYGMTRVEGVQNPSVRRGDFAGAVGAAGEYGILPGPGAR